MTGAEVRTLAETYYGKIPSRPVSERRRVEEPPQSAPRRVVMESPQVRQPSLSITYLAPSYAGAGKEHAYPLQVLEQILSGGATSRLYRTLVVEQGLATSAGAGYDATGLDSGRFTFYISPRPEVEIERAEAALRAELARLLADGVDEQEVATAKQRLRSAAVFARDSLGTAPNIFGRALTTGQTVADVEAWPARIEAVTKEGIDAAARAVLRDAQSVTGLLLPETHKLTRGPLEIRPTHWICFMVLRRLFSAPALVLFALAFVAIGPARAVEVQRVVSPGGIEAWLVEDHGNPIISLDIAFRGGAALDPAGKEGLANMVSGLIDEGAGDLDSQAFQGALEDRSISLRFSAGLESFTGGLVTLSEHRALAFRLLRLALTEPRFDEEPVRRIRAQILAGLERQAEDPDHIARRTMSRMLFPSHPYGRPRSGTPESVAAISAQDLYGFVARRLARDNLVIGVVGDITPQDLARALDETFLALPAVSKPVAIAEAVPQGTGDLVVVDRDQPQSVVAFGHAGLKRDDPDYYAAYVANHILGGGGFSSRLYREVREKRGLAYSVYSYLHPLDHAGLVMGGVATQNGRVATTLEVLRDEWRRMAEQGPSAAELDAAKTFLTGSFPLRFSSSGRISGMLVGLQLQHLGIDYIDRRNSLIDAVTLEDARQAPRHRLSRAPLTRQSSIPPAPRACRRASWSVTTISSPGRASCPATWASGPTSGSSASCRSASTTASISC